MPIPTAPLMKQATYLLLLFIIFSGCSKSDNSSGFVDHALSDSTNLQYGAGPDTSGNNVNLALDLYYPQGAATSKKLPLMVLIHGGTYLNGDKSDVYYHAQILADSGFVVAAINYRLGWRAGTGNCDGDVASELEAGYRAIQDANAALRFLTANARQLGIDTSWIFIGGLSAGSSLALNTAYIPNSEASIILPADFTLLGSINTADNSLRNTFTIKGICNMWGALPDSNLITAASALPTISFHGTADPVVPYDIGYDESCTNYIMLYGSACIQRRLEFYNVAAIANFVIGGGHQPSVYTPEFLMGNTACFLHRVINHTPITSQVYTTLVSSCN